MAGALAACAGAKSAAPSFAIPSSSAQTGRVAVSFPGVSAPEPFVSDPLADPIPDEPEARIAAINARAVKATAAFAEAAPTARRLASAARGAPTSSNRWAEAEVSIADLTSLHGQGHLALAEFDLLGEALVRSEAEPALIAEVAAAQARLSGALNEQDAQLTAISALLER